MTVTRAFNPLYGFLTPRWKHFQNTTTPRICGFVPCFWQPSRLAKISVLFHCSDGKLYETTCDDPVEIQVYGIKKQVRMLTTISSFVRDVLNDFFGDQWPLQQWDDSPKFKSADCIEQPIDVLSRAGRREIDDCHRKHVRNFPTLSCTVIQAPPGAGKTTSIVEMIKDWGKRVLVITFNKATQQTMKQELLQNDLWTSEARTLDSLCRERVGKQKL